MGELFVSDKIIDPSVLSTDSTLIKAKGPIHDFGFAARQSVVFPAYMRSTERVVGGKRINLPQRAIKIRKENIEGIERGSAEFFP